MDVCLGRWVFGWVGGCVAEPLSERTDRGMLFHLDSCWVLTMLEKVAKKA